MPVFELVLTNDLAGKNMIFDGIQHYITHSPNTNGRKFHFTMTYFWIQMVHFGMERARLNAATASGTPASSTATLTNDVPEPAKAFADFLLTNPFVADGRLWADYYSSEVLMSDEAKREFVLPDKKPLPDVVRTA